MYLPSQNQTQQKPLLPPGLIIQKYQATAPVNVVGIANELGLNVWAMQMPSNVSGKIFPDMLNGGWVKYSIAVNASEAPVRQRFTVAHEIAHFILHRNQVSGGLIDDVMYRSGLSTKEEVEANRLAADILMPHALIRTLIASGVKSVEALAATLQVSLPAMKIRLGIPVT